MEVKVQSIRFVSDHKLNEFIKQRVNKLNLFFGLLVFFWLGNFLNRRALLTIEEISFKDRSSTEVIFLDTTSGVFIQTQEIIKY